MKFQCLFSGKNKKNIINLSSVKYAQRVVMVKRKIQTAPDKYFILGITEGISFLLSPQNVFGV